MVCIWYNFHRFLYFIHYFIVDIKDTLNPDQEYDDTPLPSGVSTPKSESVIESSRPDSDSEDLLKIASGRQQQLSLKYLTYPLLLLASSWYFPEGPQEPSSSTNKQKIQTLGKEDKEFLVNTLRTVFSSSESLNQSFLLPKSTQVDDGGCRVDIESVRLSYALIISLVLF